MLVFRNSKQPIEEAGAVLCSYLGEGGEDTPKLFLASGGSSFSLLDHIRDDVLGRHITISVLDERYSRDSEVNNFAQLTTHIFHERAVARGCGFIDTRPEENETCGMLTDRFEAALRDWKKENPQGKIIATQGIAPNGHTAGIMPMSEDPNRFNVLFEGDDWVVGYTVDQLIDPHTERITTTFSFLRNEVYAAVGFAVDEKKRDILKQTLEEKNELHKVPARVMHQMKNVIMVSNVL